MGTTLQTSYRMKAEHMPQSIQTTAEQCNNYFSLSPIVICATTHDLEYQASLLVPLGNLSKTQSQLLFMAYREKLSGYLYSDRSLTQLGLMFNRHMQTVSRNLVALENGGYLVGKRLRRANKMRTISQAAFMLLDIRSDKSREKLMLNQEPSYTNNNLFQDLVRSDYSNALYDVEDEKSSEESLEAALDDFFKLNPEAEEQEDAIRGMLKRSRIRLERKIDMFNRIVAAHKKKPILDYLQYFKTCIAKEEKIFSIHIDLKIKFLQNPKLVTFHRFKSYGYGY